MDLAQWTSYNLSMLEQVIKYEAVYDNTFVFFDENGNISAILAIEGERWKKYQTTV